MAPHVEDLVNELTGWMRRQRRRHKRAERERYYRHAEARFRAAKRAYRYHSWEYMPPRRYYAPDYDRSYY